jgi:hypothetical protein
MPGATGRHAQTFCRRISGTRRDAMAIARAVPVDDLHVLVTVVRYDGFDRVLREHKTTRIAKRVDGVWYEGDALTAYDEARKAERIERAAGAALVRMAGTS